MVYLGANACIVGRNVEKTEGMAKDIATARKGAKVLGIGAIDVRNVESLQKSVATCVEKLGGIDYVMYVARQELRARGITDFRIALAQRAIS